MFNKILVVCVGNICRSPVGEILLRERLPENYTVRSAGLGALVGKPIDKSSEAWLKAQGSTGEQHLAQQLSSELVQWADLILVMEKRHVEELSSRYPAVRGKTHLLGKWLGEAEIPDPYRQSQEAFEFALGKVDDGVDAWLKKLGF